jgi:O-antigen/teichoic acid export membrane protein
LQTLFITALTFILYRLMLDRIGIDNIGVWSLVLSSVNIVGVGNFGISSLLTKFVAEYTSTERWEDLHGIIGTSLTIVFGFMLLISVVFYVLFSLIIASLFSHETAHMAVAQQLVPYAIGSLLLNFLAVALTSCLEGVKKIYIKSLITSLSFVCYFIACYVLMQHFGLLGLAYAQLIQAVVLLLMALMATHYFIPKLRLHRLVFQRDKIKIVFQYGANLQIANIAQIVGDPLLKTLMSKFGGLTATAYYDMAQKVSGNVRNLLVNANQAVVPEFAQRQALNDLEGIKKLFTRNQNLIFSLCAVVFCAILGLSNVISFLWLGHVEGIFVYILCFVTFGHWLNALSVPAYFLYLGTGDLRHNTRSAVLIVLTYGVVGSTLGYFLGMQGVLIAWVCGCAVGMVWLLWSVRSLSAQHLWSGQKILFLFVLGVLTFWFWQYSTVLTMQSILSKLTMGAVLVAVLGGCIYRFDWYKQLL